MKSSQNAPQIPEWQQRTAILYGDKRMAELGQKHVVVVGLGGVGAYAAEMLCRAGIGRMTIVDADVVSPTNINRQLPALHSTVGRSKAQVLRERFIDINPALEVTAVEQFIDASNLDDLLADRPDFVVDAIDSVRPKCHLIEHCLDNKLPIVSAMGAGAKIDISRVRVGDLWKTTQCALAKTVRSYLKSDGYQWRRLPVVWSDEPVRRDAIVTVSGERNKRSTAGTVAYITAAFGLYLAYYVLEHICKTNNS